MSSLKEINLRINSLKNTKKITEAMKLIAVTKLSKAQSNVSKSKGYYSYLQKILSSVSESDAFQEHALIDKDKPAPSVKKIKLLVFTSDKGLCGPFNANVIKFAKKIIDEKRGLGLEIKTDHFGKKGYEAIKKENIVGEWYENVFKDGSFGLMDSQELLDKEIANFLHGKMDEYYLVYNKFVSVLKQVPVIRKIVPLSVVDEGVQEKSEANQAGSSEKILPNFVFEPNKEVVIDSLIKKIIYFELFYAYLNTVAGENSARMTAMDSATSNCNDMIDRFTLERNQLRQANITSELVEIISGAESV